MPHVLCHHGFELCIIRMCVSQNFNVSTHVICRIQSCFDVSFSLVSGEWTLTHKPLATCCNFSSALVINSLSSSEVILQLNSGGSETLLPTRLCHSRCTQQREEQSIPPHELLKSFQWKCLLDELKSHTPILLKNLKSCIGVRRLASQQQAVIGVINAVLCKNRRNSASLVQQIISVILYSGHASKMVSI